MPHFLEMQAWLRGLAETAGNVVFGVAALLAAFRLVRYTHRRRHHYRQDLDA